MTGTPPTESSVREVADREFEVQVERRPRPVVVMFSSGSCPQCRSILPSIEASSHGIRDRVSFVVMDVGAHPSMVERYGFRRAPTLTFFCHGRPVQEIVGANSPSAIRRPIERFEARGEECIRRSTEIACEITGYV